MRLILGALALTVAGVATYGLQGGFDGGNEPVLAPEVPLREPVRDESRAYTRPLSVTLSQPVPETGRVTVFSGKVEKGWVKPDPARLVAAAPAAKPRAVPNTARAPKGPKVASATSSSRHVKDHRRESTVWQIKNSFRKSSQQRLFQKPAWMNSRNNFSDRMRYRQRG